MAASVAAANGQVKTRVTVPLVLGSSRPGAGWPVGMEAQPSVELGSLLDSGCCDFTEGEVSHVWDRSEGKNRVRERDAGISKCGNRWKPAWLQF